MRLHPRGRLRSREACMSRLQKTWGIVVALFVGALPPPAQAAGAAKAGPRPLPPGVLKAWTAAGARLTSPPNTLPVFGFTYSHTLPAKLPNPGVPFGLRLDGFF